MSVLVVGAGLSGLAAALELARAGIKVTVAERRAFPGGRAFSFEGADGEELDNGQHVFLGCCTAYRKFVADVGADDLVYLQPRTAVPFIDARTRRTSWLRSSRFLPSPMHFAPSVLRYKPLRWSERRAALRCAREMMSADRTALDDVSMGEWLRDRGQSPEAIRDFWDIAMLPVFSDTSDRVSAAAGLFLFREAFFGAKDAARVGWNRGGLGGIARRAVDAIRAAGGEVKFGAKVESLAGFDYYIPAVPARQLLELLTPEQRASDFFWRAADMPMSPIVNVHLRFDRPVWDLPFAAFVGSPVQWLFSRGGDGSRLTITLSGVRELVERKNEEIQGQFVDELRRLLPAARDAAVESAVVVREREATFVAAPRARAKRLPCETPIPNVFLAGEWTESEWPSTMEAAVRSGVRAARLVLRAAQRA